MESVYLMADVGRDAVLNADGLTLLRNIYLVQGTSYDVFLAFRNNGVATATPTIASFSFTVGSPTALFASGFLSASGNADFPLKFTVLADSPALTAALTGQGAISVTGQVSWANGASVTLLAPFNVKITASTAPVDPEGTASTVAYATPTQAETKVLTSVSPTGWLVDCTNTAATFTLPDAATVSGVEYFFQKTDATAHTLTANCLLGQTIKSFSRLTVSNGGGTVAISRGVFTDASLYVKNAGDVINVTAINGGWITDDFSGDVV